MVLDARTSSIDVRGTRRLPVDVRIVQEIQRTPRMLREQGSGFMQRFGGPESYVTMSRLPVNERMTYAAVLAGYSNEEEIAEVSDLSSSQVTSALAKLKRKKLVRTVAVPTEPEVV